MVFGLFADLSLLRRVVWKSLTGKAPFSSYATIFMFQKLKTSIQGSRVYGDKIDLIELVLTAIWCVVIQIKTRLLYSLSSFPHPKETCNATTAEGFRAHVRSSEGGKFLVLIFLKSPSLVINTSPHSLFQDLTINFLCKKVDFKFLRFFG